jgi:methyl-accepting chemotaxis protein
MQTISSRMIAALAVLLFCTGSLALVAWMTQDKQAAALNELYANNVVPLRDLKIISDRYAVDVVDAAHKTRNGNITRDDAVKTMKAAIAEIDTLWSKFRDMPHSPEELELVKAADVKLSDAGKATREAIAIIERKDNRALEIFVIREMYAAIEPGTDYVTKLIDMMLRNASNIEKGAIEAGKLSRLVLMVVALIGFVVCCAAIGFTIFGVVRPLRGSISTMNALANATVGAQTHGAERLTALNDIEIAGTTRGDEIGEMARTLQTFKEAGIERQRLRVEAEIENTERHARAERLEAIIADFESATMTIVASVATASNELEASAKMMQDTARTTSEQSSLVAAASHQASQSVQTLAATGDELALSIGEIGRQAEQSSVYASNAAEKARDADTTVATLSEAGAAIVEVIDLIKSIASQTNLLALNATIEAARAGEAGKGFAVVASEVKELASQTTRATDVIAEHVGAIRNASNASTIAMREIGEMIGEINQVASAIAVAVTEQSQATQGIAENVQQVAQGTEHAAESIAVVSEAAANTGSAAGQVLSASAELAEQSMLMRSKIDDFLQAVRAA